MRRLVLVKNRVLYAVAGMVLLALGVITALNISDMVSADEGDDKATPQAAGVGFPLMFQPGGAPAWSLAFNLFSDGTKVGIGTVSPQARLHVAEGDWILGSSASLPGFGVSGWLTSGAGNLYEAGGESWAHHFSAYGGGDIALFGTSDGPGQQPDTKVVIMNDGRVGIGTANPQSLLHVFEPLGGIGSAIMVDSEAAEDPPNILFAVNGEQQANIRVAPTEAQQFQIGVGSPSNFAFNIDKSGNVGIGTTEPQSKLQIDGGNINVLVSSDANLTLQGDDSTPGNSNASLNFVNRSKPDGGSWWHMTNRAGNENIESHYRPQGFPSNFLPPVVPLVLAPTGNVGIGTTEPRYPLQVQRDDGVSEGFHRLAKITRLAGGTEDAGVVMSYHANGSEADISNLLFVGGTDAAVRLFDESQGQTITPLYMKAEGGNVGIGTMDPQSALQVSGYTQLDLTAGAPPAEDCDEASEAGRMKVDPDTDTLWVCMTSGWVAK